MEEFAGDKNQIYMFLKSEMAEKYKINEDLLDTKGNLCFVKETPEMTLEAYIEERYEFAVKYKVGDKNIMHKINGKWFCTDQSGKLQPIAEWASYQDLYEKDPKKYWQN